MKVTSIWTRIVSVFNVLTFQTTNINEQPSLQAHLDSTGNHNNRPAHPYVDTAEVNVASWADTADDGKAYFLQDGTPLIPISKNGQEGPKGLACQYPDMKGYKSCHGPDNRDCWLQKKNKVIGINTDYEDVDAIPVGITRKYYLEVGEEPIYPDRVVMEHGKVFNRTYPGPWIEACWGDWIEVKVLNGLRWNGTSIHWHGFRQLGTSHQDGVNGVTECPIAPGDSYTYRFRAMQYGSAWYHSHYGLQYGDGLLGPITVYGPSTANYDTDESFRPILMTDWNHRSVFEEWPSELKTGNAPQMTNILLNGTGQFGPGGRIEDKYQLTFTPRRKHKLILVNTSVDTIFVFSIDNHKFTIIEMDFVPIKPYVTGNLKIGIGQRYHIIVEGLADPYTKERDGNYWMRTTPARYCNKFAYGPDEATGIIRYNSKMSTDVASISEPDEPDDLHCGDEDHKKLIPWLGWRIGNPANIDPSIKLEDIPIQKRYLFEVAMQNSSGEPYRPDDPRLRWTVHTDPFRINFSDPTLLNLDKIDKLIKDQPYLDIVTYGEDVKDKWIWMVLTASALPITGGRERSFFPMAHPMHLHGHDFAILYQSEYPWYDDFNHTNPRTGFHRKFTADKLNCQNPYINCNNPARRDVVMLPAGGFVIMAFKADNPGAWIFHCHIAFHASSGLAMQILENKHLIPKTLDPDLPAIKKRCENWNNWFNDDKNHWDSHNPNEFQDDSGV